MNSSSGNIGSDHVASCLNHTTSDRGLAIENTPDFHNPRQRGWVRWLSGRRCKGRRTAAFLALALVGVLAGLSRPPAARAFTCFEGTSTAFSDILGSPNDHLRWTRTTITYKFDANFDAMFPNPAIKDQVRLAFQQWAAMSSTPYGPTDDFDRTLGGGHNFIDMRSLTLHEIGHTLGLGHPEQGAAVSRNYQPAMHVCPGVNSVQPNNNLEVMHQGIDGGWYRQVLTFDELDAYCFVYGSTTLNFVEVLDPTPADILITTYADANPNTWAKGVPSSSLINPMDPSQGRRIDSAAISYNNAAGTPFGFMGLAVNWDYVNMSGSAARSMRVRTTGCNNPNALWHFDNPPYPDNPSGQTFGTFTTTPIGSSAKDDLTHVWSSPSGGDIPAGNRIHIGLQLDVWDWSVVSSFVYDPLGVPTAAPLTVIHGPWYSTVVTGTPAAAPPTAGDMKKESELAIVARGFRLVTTEVPTHVSSVFVADVTGMHLTLPQLNLSLVRALSSSNRLEAITNFPPMDFAPTNDFIFVLQGQATNLPPDIQQRGNFLLMNRPDLVDKDLLVFALSTTPDATVGTYALITTNPSANVPVAGLTATLLPNCQLKLSWPYPLPGYELQSTPSLTPPATWSAVNLPVTVANGIQYVIVSNICQGQQFFRLARTQLPTFSVAQPGVTPAQANVLAQRLNLPASAFGNSLALHYTDPNGFLQIPTQVIGPAGTNTEPGDVVDEAILFNQVNQLTVLDDATAQHLAQDALGAAGLFPAAPYQAYPVMGHSQFQAVDTAGNKVSDLPIDTQVHYNLQLANLPVVGPGAKVSFVFGATQNVTHLAYALRGLQQGPLLPILSQAKADAQAMALYQDMATQGTLQLSSRLVYYAPDGNLASVTTLFPHYEYGGTFTPFGGTNVVLLRKIFIPAVAVTSLVPSASISGGISGKVVSAQAIVSGGLPPYTYVWSSSSVTLSNTGPSVSYFLSPPRTNAATETLTLLVTDANGLTAVATFSGTIPSLALTALQSGGPGPQPKVVGVVDIGTEWVGTSMGLSGSAANAGGFVSRFAAAGGSVLRFNWGDYNAWQTDFEDPIYGGDDTHWVDNADAVFYTGHANGDGWAFPSHHNDTFISYSQCLMGNNDNDWLVIAACGPLQEGAYPHRWFERWGPTFGGLHLLCGYQTVTYDNTIEGNHWANYMLSGWTVRQAWMQTGMDAQGHDQLVAVMGTFGTGGVSNWNDHYWGYGSVGPEIYSKAGYWMISSPCD